MKMLIRMMNINQDGGEDEDDIDQDEDVDEADLDVDKNEKDQDDDPDEFDVEGKGERADIEPERYISDQRVESEEKKAQNDAKEG